jgi:GATA-binding protein, other eukaryote
VTSFPRFHSFLVLFLFCERFGNWTVIAVALADYFVPTSYLINFFFSFGLIVYISDLRVILIFFSPSSGLYFKLHGTHRPNSMKKTVIKRRKRVSAAGTAGNISGRMSDQAAAEALVAVGRLGVSPGEAGNDESDGEADQPKKKRTRRGGKPQGGGTDKDDDVVMDGEDDEDTRESGQQTQRETRKRRGVNGWVESGRSNSPQHRAPQRNQDYSRTGGGGVGLPTFPGSGFELPPLAALNNGAAFLGNASAPPSSYIRSGSNAPSRTHSPLGPAGSSTGYVLPPPHGLSQYYPSTPPADMSTLMVAAGVALGGLGIPSYMDLERHYVELTEQKRKWEEMMERTDRLMAGVKRTLDEMRGLVAQQSTPPPPPQSLQQQTQQQQQPSSAPGTAAGSPKSMQQPQQPSTASSSPKLQPIEEAAVVQAVPVNRGGSAGERERNVIWPVADATSVHD